MISKVKAFALALALVVGFVGAGTERAAATIASPTVSVTATGNSVTTLWNYGFIIPYQANGTTPAVTVSTTTSGVTTVINPSLYTITGVGNSAGGTVHYPLSGSPLTSATTITITRSLAYIQPTAVPNAAFLPHTVEQVADNLDMQIQQLAALGGGGGGGACTAGTCVTSLNGLTDAVNIVAGSNITVTPAGSSITIASTGGGGGSGTVTSVATDGSLSGGPITTAGTLSRAALTGDITASAGSNATTLATVNSNVGSFGSTTTSPIFTVNAKGLITAASSTGLSAMLDATFGSARGDLLYRNGTVWTVLTPGTSGQFLQTLGAGADPAWATAGGGGSGCTVSGGAQFQILVNDGASGCSSSANGSVTVGAAKFGQSGTLGTVELGNATSGTIKLSPVAGALGSTVLTLPAGSDTLAAIAATQTLTNKSISGSANTLSNIALTSLATQATNTVLVNATSGSASPTAQAVSSCSASTSALTWTTNTGFGCHTISGSGAGTVADITALRALTSVTPATNVVLGWSTAGVGGGTFTYNSADTTTSDNSCTIIVDASSHRWYRQYSGPIDVTWCGALGDGSTDDKTALRAALALGPAVYVPPNANCFRTSDTLTISHDQSITGAGPDVSCIKATTAANAIFIVPVHADTTNKNITIAGLTLDRTIAATAGGDGIGFTSYVDNTILDNLYIKNQYVGVNLVSTDASWFRNSVVTGSYSDGVVLTSSSWYPTVQWQLLNDYSTSNEGRGFTAKATSAAGCGSMGEWINLATFANFGYGVDVEGLSSSDCLQGFRLSGGFFGQDANDEIHINGYNTGAGQNSIAPKYVELAGTSATGRTGSHSASNTGAGIYLSANVGPTIVSCGVCNQNSYDGLTSLASSLQVTGGTYTNNGLVGRVGSTCNTATRCNGINIAAGGTRGTQIGAVTAGNTAGSTSQIYGVVLYGGGDYLSVSGANLLNNATDYGTGLATTNSVLSGVLPISANTAPSGAYCLLTGCTITGNMTVTGTLTDSTDLVANGTTHLNGVTALNDNVNLAASKQITGASGSGLTVDNIKAAVSEGIGVNASGTAGRLDVTTVAASGAISGTTGTFSSAISGTTGTFSGAISGTQITSSTDLIANGLFHANGASAFAAGSTWTGSNSITVGGGVTALDVAATRSLGVGTGASGTAGRIDTTTMVASGAVSGTTGTFSGAVSGTTGTFTGNITGSLDIAVATLHVSGASALHGTTVVSGGLSVTAGGLSADNIQTAGSLGVGTTASGTAGRIDNTTQVATGQIQAQDLYATRGLGVGTAAPTGFNGAAKILGLGVGGSAPVNGNLVVAGDITDAGNITLMGGNISGGADVSTTTLHVSGASAIHATTVVSGGIAVTGGITGDNASITGGIAVGSPTGGVGSAGTVNVGTGLYLNNSAYTFP